MNRYILIINGTPSILGKRSLKNWDEISYSLKRNDFSGVIRSFSSQFEFTEEAYNLLLDEYHVNYLKANAQIEVYSMDNERNKRLIYGSYLDFGSLEYDDTTVYINAVDNTLAAKIKAKKSTQYEYPVAELKEEKPLYYDRLLMQNSVNYIFGGSTNDDGNSFYDFDIKYTQSRYISPFMDVLDKEIIYNPNLEFSMDESYDTPTGGRIERYALVKNTGEDAVMVSFDIDFVFYITDLSNQSIKVSFAMHRSSRDASIISSEKIGSGMELNVKYKEDVLVSPGEYIYFLFNTHLDGGGWDGIKGKIVTKNNFLKLTFFSRGKCVNIDLVSPYILLNRLIKSINEDKEGYIGEIEAVDDCRLSSTMIMAAESARGLENAKLYTSFKKFCDWMEAVYGYVPDIADNKVVFKKRTSLFHSVIQKRISYTGDNFKVKVNSSLIYSLVRAGYDKQDYDSINGRDEFHFTNEYDTGITITDKALDLISPFRADPYGIEFLASKRGEDTTDRDSDNDTFFVGVNLPAGSDYYKLVREAYSITGIISVSSMFNVMFSPRSVIEANKEFIASFASNLRFASSSGNSDIVINGVAENSDIVLTDPLFSVDTLNISAADGALPADVNALVEVQRNSKLYTCFVNELKYKIGRYDGVDYSLQIKNISLP